MCRIFILLIIALASTRVAVAQDSPKTELFTGYSHLRAEGEYTNGWNVSILRNLSERLALLGDFGGHYRSWDGTDLSLYSFLGGVQFSARLEEKVRVFARGLVGAGHGRGGGGASPGTISVKCYLVGLGVYSTYHCEERRVQGVAYSESDTSLLYGGGGGIDVSLTERFSLRAVQFDYLRDDDGGSAIRLSFGLVVGWF